MWYIYTKEYYSAIKKTEIMSLAATWIDLEILILTEVSQKEKHQYSILTHIYGVQNNGNNDPICKTAKETHM